MKYRARVEISNKWRWQPNFFYKSLANPALKVADELRGAPDNGGPTSDCRTSWYCSNGTNRIAILGMIPV